MSRASGGRSSRPCRGLAHEVGSRQATAKGAEGFPLSKVRRGGGSGGSAPWPRTCVAGTARSRPLAGMPGGEGVTERAGRERREQGREPVGIVGFRLVAPLFPLSGLFPASSPEGYSPQRSPNPPHPCPCIAAAVQLPDLPGEVGPQGVGPEWLQRWERLCESRPLSVRGVMKTIRARGPGTLTGRQKVMGQDHTAELSG